MHEQSNWLDALIAHVRRDLRVGHPTEVVQVEYPTILVLEVQHRDSHRFDVLQATQLLGGRLGMGKRGIPERGIHGIEFVHPSAAAALGVLAPREIDDLALHHLCEVMTEATLALGGIEFAIGNASERRREHFLNDVFAFGAVSITKGTQADHRGTANATNTALEEHREGTLRAFRRLGNQCQSGLQSVIRHAQSVGDRTSSCKPPPSR